MFVLCLHSAMKSLERILVNSFKCCCEIKENTGDWSCHFCVSCLRWFPINLSQLLSMLTFHTSQYGYSMHESSLLCMYNPPPLSSKPARSNHEERCRATRNLPLCFIFKNINQIHQYQAITFIPED